MKISKWVEVRSFQLSAWQNLTIVHIDPMLPNSHSAIQSNPAILSVATGDTSILAAGQPVLAHQIAALRSVGVSKFLIEVDSIPGSLLSMADALISSGCEIQFVRSTNDLRSNLGDADLVIVQAEGVYFAPDLLRDLLRQPGAFIATVDGRDENQAFERMDLNTRWAGMAVTCATTIASIGELPDGWSMTSSLLRQAMQDGVTQYALKQSAIQRGELRHIVSGTDADSLATELIAQRTGREPGLIETQIFTPIAAKIASSLWHIKARALYADAATLFLGVACFGLAAAGWIAAAAVAAIGAIFGNSTRLALGSQEVGNALSRLVSPVMWVLLGIALLWAAESDAYQPSDGLFAGGIVFGLAVLTRHLRLPEWARQILQSPAMIAILLLLSTPIAGIYAVAKLIAVIQLVLLTVAKWNHTPNL